MSNPTISATAPRIQTPATAPPSRPQTSTAPTLTPQETSSDRVELSSEVSGAGGGNSALLSGLTSNYDKNRARKAQLDKDFNNLVKKVSEEQRKRAAESREKIKAAMKRLL